MLNFRAMTLEDYAWMKEMQEASGQSSCHHLPGNIFLWGPDYNTKICRLNGDFFTTYSEMKHSYCFPVGRGDCRAALETLMLDAGERGVPFRLFGIMEHNREALEQWYPGRFSFRETRDFEDYVYNTDDLTALPGKKYHQKRNHIAAFLRSYDWSYEPLGEGNIAACVDFQHRWFSANEAKNPADLATENTVVLSALKNFSALGFVGGVLYAGGEMAGFTLGERINDEIFCTHIEKADGSLRGAYPMLNQQFAQNALGAYRFVNREEDMGDPGLRQAKLSYHPAELLKAYAVSCRRE